MMKKIIKKFNMIIMILCLMISYFLTPLAVEAKSSANTLAELRKELQAYQNQYNSATYNKNRTQSEINSSKNQINTSQAEIENNQKKIEQAKKDIAALEEDIKNTKIRIEEIVRNYEVSNGDNEYLEYIFKAKNMSDFIVRYSVSEQLANYNDELINGYKDKIEQNEQLKADLAKREEELNKKIDSLESAIASLGNKINVYVKEAVDAQTDINSTKQLIKYYESIGCGENEDFKKCVSVKGDTRFARPLNKGTISSLFGYRTHPVTGAKQSFHTGLDIAGNAEGTKIYASANGMVGKVLYKQSCGGNQVYIYHTINGVKYTSGYMHMLTVNVKVGDKVDANTVIGTVGGGRGTISYEKCSTGAHLHFMIAKGWYGSTYVSYSTFVSNLQNPTSYINLPNKVWASFSTRY